MRQRDSKKGFYAFIYCIGSSKGLYACIYWKKWRFGRVTPMPHWQTTEDRATQLLYSIQFKLSHAICYLSMTHQHSFFRTHQSPIASTTTWMETYWHYLGTTWDTLETSWKLYGQRLGITTGNLATWPLGTTWKLHGQHLRIAWDNLEKDWRQLSDNLGTTLRQLEVNLGTTVKQLLDNLGQPWDHMATTT